MQSFLKSYEISMQTSTPVFIGSGDKIGKKEYVYERFENRVLIPDIEKMFQFLRKKRLLGAYEDYLVNGRQDLFFFFKDQNITKKEYKTWMKVSLPVADKDLINRNTKEIMTFIKDVYGMPYIPGSSIKGALRTALLGDRLLRDRRLARDYEEKIDRARQDRRNRYLNGENAGLDCSAFHRQRSEDVSLSNEVNDTLAGLIISDSCPLRPEDMCICQKVDYTTDGSSHRLPLLRECLKPGVIVRFNITIDTSICTFNLEDILQALQNKYNNYCREFSDHFQNAPKVRQTAEYPIMMLGGGIGFPSKTCIYEIVHGQAGKKMTGKIIDATVQRGGKSHLRDVEKGASPRVLKCTVYDGKMMQMGMCSIVKVAEQ